MAMVTLGSIDRVISKARFLMGAAVGLQLAFLTVLIMAGVCSPVGVQIGQVDAGVFVIITTGLVWFLLVMRSLNQGHFLRQAALLISQGHALQAVPFLAMVLEQFSVFRLPKLIALQYLMELAYAQKDAPAAARLADEIIRHGLSWRKGLARRACLVLADSLMQMGDADTASRTLARLHGQTLTVHQRLQLLPILLRWQMMNGRYTEAVADLEEKVQLAALLNCEQACLVHVLLATAAARRGLCQISRFLLRRAGLHYNLETLARNNPSVASYLVQLQTPQHDPLENVGGRTAYVQAANPAVSQDVQTATETASPSADHVCSADGGCDIHTHP